MSDGRGVGPSFRETEPFLSSQEGLTLQRIQGTQGSDFTALESFVMRNPRYRLAVQGRLPRKSDALDVMTELPPGFHHGMKKYVWSIRLHGGMVGYLEVLRHWPTRAHLYIGALMIGETWQRQGLGSAALQRLAERSRGWAGIRHWRLAVAQSARASHEFWLQQGFHDTGQELHSPHYPTPLIVMERIKPA